MTVEQWEMAFNSCTSHASILYYFPVRIYRNHRGNDPSRKRIDLSLLPWYHRQSHIVLQPGSKVDIVLSRKLLLGSATQSVLHPITFNAQLTDPLYA